MSDTCPEVATLKGLIRAYQRDAVLFVQKVLGVNPTGQQKRALQAISKPGARVTIKSGHGTGKTTLMAWVVLWHVSCFPDSKAPCTAPTGHQLQDLLWAEIAKWHKRMNPIFADQIEVGRDKVFLKADPEGQFAVARTSRKENPEALQGFHARHLLFLVDEASGVPDVIFEPMRGALSTKGARVLLAANPTRTDGLFYRTHHALKDTWECIHFSCVDSPMVSPEYIAEMALDYGEDSDIYRVRVLGEFPKQSINQLFGPEIVEECMGRHLRDDQFHHAPVVLGVDVAWEGDDRSCVYLRQGLMSRELGVWYGIDNMTLADRVADFINQYRPAAVFIDVGWGTGVIDRLRQLGYTVTPVNFGSKALNTDRYQNKRAEMWCLMKLWAEAGGALPDDDAIRDDLLAPSYFFTPTGKIQLEAKKDMKRRGCKSPDKADALALTFAMPVAPTQPGLRLTRQDFAVGTTSSVAGCYNALGRVSDYDPLGV